MRFCGITSMSNEVMHASTRRMSAFAFRGTLSVLDSYGVRAGVAELVRPEIRELMEHPPLPVQWISGPQFDGLLDGLHAFGGDDLIRKTSLEVLKRLAGA